MSFAFKNVSSLCFDFVSSFVLFEFWTGESIATRFSLTSEAFAAELDAFMVSEDSTSIDLNKLSKFETLMQSRQSEVRSPLPLYAPI